MKIVYFAIILASLLIATSCTKPVHADSTDPVQILDVQVEPSTLKINDTFSISATILNSSPYPIYLTSGSCTPAFSVSFDSHAKQVHPNITCTTEAILQKVDPLEETTISNVNKPGTIYQAVLAGTANANITIPYSAKNQTSSDYSNIDYSVSKSFQFTIHGSNETSQKIPAYFLPPLQQIRAGALTQNVKCSVNFNLIIKSEDGTPACVKLGTAYDLIKRDWVAIESAYPEGNAQFALKTNSTIIPGHLPRSSGIRIPYQESSSIINYTGFGGVYNVTLIFRGTPHDYVLKPGTTGTMTFKIEASALEPSDQYPTSLPKSLNLTNYAVFYHEITNPATLSKYPGVTIDDGSFRACFTRPAGGHTCIGGPYDVKGPVEAYVVDHPGVNVLFEPPSEVLSLGANTTSQVVTMTISADSDAPQGTYLVVLYPLGEFLLTVGSQPYHE